MGAWLCCVAGEEPHVPCEVEPPEIQCLRDGAKRGGGQGGGREVLKATQKAASAGGS